MSLQLSLSGIFSDPGRGWILAIEAGCLSDDGDSVEKNGRCPLWVLF
jgi:hypothetical protein